MKKRSSGRRRMPSPIAVHSEFADAIGEGTAATSPAERPAIPTTFGSALEEYQFLDRQHGGRVHIDPNDQEAMDRYERMQKLVPMWQDEVAQARMDRAKAASKPEDVEHALELMSTLASGLRTFGFRLKASNALDALLVRNENYCLLERLEIIHKGYWTEVYKLANDIRFDFCASYKPGKEAYSKEKEQEHARKLDDYVKEIRQSAAIVHGKPDNDPPTIDGREPETPTDKTQTPDPVVAASVKTAPPAVEGSEQQTPADGSRQPDPVATAPAKIDRRSIEVIEQNTPALDVKSMEWIRASKENEKKFSVTIATLRTYRKSKLGGRSLPCKSFGIDKDGRRWRRRGTPSSAVYYYANDDL